MSSDVILKCPRTTHYDTLAFGNPRLLAVNVPTILPDNHKYRVLDGPTHEITLQGSDFRVAASPQLLAVPDQLVALQFVSGKGSSKVLGHRPAREYYWVDGVVYRRATNKEAGYYRNTRTRRGGLSRRKGGLLQLYVTISRVLNDSVLHEEVEMVVGRLLMQVMGMTIPAKGTAGHDAS